MNKTEFILESATSGEVAQKIINASINIGFNDGAIQINGLCDVISISGRNVTMPIPFDQYTIRLSDTDTQSNNLLFTDSQVSNNEKKAIFQALFDSVKSATQMATQAIHQLNNPSL